MAVRIVSAVVGLPLIVLAVWFGGHWFAALVTVAALIAALEISAMARNWWERPYTPAVVILALTLVVGAHILVTLRIDARFGAVLVTTVSIAFTTWWVGALREGRSVPVVISTLCAILYPAGFLFLAPLLRAAEQGREWMLFTLLVTFATDTFALFVGRVIGKHPLAPSISPSKTIEGSVGGFMGALAVAAAARYLLSLDASLVEVLALGGLIGVVGQIGDLVESRLKRIANVKDSGWVIPGHGGILDRLDSIMFNLIVVYFFVTWAIM